MKTENKIKSGVYAIVCSKNEKIYIGSSQNITARKAQHSSELRNCKHGNDNLQRDFNKYGEQAFKFMVLERCYIPDLEEKEQYYINLYNTVESGYNIAQKAQRSSGYRHTTQNRPIVQMDINNDVIACYNTATQASITTGISVTKISDAAKLGYYSQGYNWRYATQEETEELEWKKLA